MRAFGTEISLGDEFRR